LPACVLLVLPSTVHIASASSLVDIKPATFRVADVLAAGAPLQTPELLQLNDDVVARIAADEATKSVAHHFACAANLRLVIKNKGHCYLGKSSGAGALSLWMHNMQDIDFLPYYEGPAYSGPALKLAAGVTVRQVYKAADNNNVTVTGAVSWVSIHFHH